MKQVSRLHKIVIVISLCLLVQIAIAWKLWLPIGREFPLVSAFNFLNFRYGIFVDGFLFGLLCFSIAVLMLRPFSKLWISIIKIVLILLILEDINRLQPWVYMYALMLLSVAVYNPKENEQQVLFLLRLMLAATYVWSGIQKFNHEFATEIFPWVVKPIGMKEFFTLHHRLAYIIPLTEILAGIGLLYKKFQRYAALVLMAMHFVLLIVLGPTGHEWNKLIWPWNAALIIILFLLSKDEEYRGLTISVRPRLKSAWFFVVVLLTCVMPVFNFIGCWDYDLSGSLYSGNNPEAMFYYIKADRNNMPLSARHAQVYYPASDGEFLMIDQWALDDMNAPIYPEERYFKRIAAGLCSKVSQPSSAGLLINEKKMFTGKSHELTISCDSLVKYQ